MSRTALLFSGGLDSLALWRLLRAEGERPTLVYHRTGHRYEAVERAAIWRVTDVYARAGEPVTVVRQAQALDLARWERADGHVPLRNLLFAAAAAVETGATRILLAAVAGESSRDKSARFLADTSRLLTYLLHRPVRVEAPTRRWTKAELLERAIAADPTVRGVVRVTRSCYTMAEYDGRLAGCGACMACFRRWVALAHNGIAEPVAAPPWRWWWAHGETRSQLEWLRAAVRQVPVREWRGLARNHRSAVLALKRHAPPRRPQGTRSTAAAASTTTTTGVEP